MRLLISVIIISFLCGCSSTKPGAKIMTEDSAELRSTTDETTLESLSSALSWSSEPDEIIVQYDQFGGLMGSGPGTNLPLWTLYGDGLVVWTEDGPVTPGFTRQVWVGNLSDAEIEKLLNFIDQQGFWDLAPSYQPEQFLEPTLNAGDALEGLSVVDQNPEAVLDQPSSVILVVTSDRRYQVTVFPAGWSDAPEAYQDIIEYLLEMRQTDVAQFTPTDFSLRAREEKQITADDPNVAKWPYTDINLSEVSNVPMVLDYDQGIAVADFIATNGQRVVQDEIVYLVTLMGVPPR